MDSITPKFPGFRQPKESWFRLPNEWTDIMCNMGLAETRIVVYILRHTWGFRQSSRRMALDEFVNGRKKRDGTRMDCGTNLSLPSVRLGIKNAIKHGYLEVVEDRSDLGRIKRWYRLRMMSKDGNTSEITTQSRDGKSQSLGVDSDTVTQIRGKVTLPHPESNFTPYRERNYRKDTSLEDKSSNVGCKQVAPPSRNGHSRNGILSTPFTQGGANRLKAILDKFESDLVRSPHKVRLDTLEKNFILLSQADVSQDRIKNVVSWLADHYDDEFTPKIHKSGDFEKNFGRYEDAIKRWKLEREKAGENPDDPPEKPYRDHISSPGDPGYVAFTDADIAALAGDPYYPPGED